MFIKRIILNNFRNYELLDIELKNGINIIYGDNAQGKTNLLESLYVLGLTKSHRSFIDNNLIKKIAVDKTTQAQLISGRLAIARLVVDNSSESEYAIIPASVADKIAQRDANSIVLNSALSQEEQDGEDPYADFKVPDDLMW